MTPRRAVLDLALVTLIPLGAAAAQEHGAAPPTASAPHGGGALPPAVSAALAEIRDLTFDFDQPGFYAILEFVRREPLPPAVMELAPFVADWGVLSERPRSFRGRLITIEGVVGRNKAWTLEPQREPPGPTVWQLELSGTQPQPIAATVILTHDASDIPLGATIRVSGVFVMVRQYHGRGNQARQAALLVAAGPITVERVVESAGGFHPSATVGVVAALVAGLAVAWVLLRRTQAATRPQPAGLRAARPAPVSLAEDLAEWARDESGVAGEGASPAGRDEGPPGEPRG